jgi:uncharacterized protein YidB (DUF937 family)
MGLFDSDNNAQAVPGGSLAKPLMIAVGALLISRMFSHGSSTPEAAAPAAPQADPTVADGGLMGGLGGLLEKLSGAGHADTVNSWVGNGTNAPIQPGHLGEALGPQTVNDLSQKTGLDPKDLLAQLSQNLPGIVDKLTANGQIPNLQDLARMLQQRQA